MSEEITIGAFTIRAHKSDCPQRNTMTNICPHCSSREEVARWLYGKCVGCGASSISNSFDGTGIACAYCRAVGVKEGK